MYLMISSNTDVLSQRNLSGGKKGGSQGENTDEESRVDEQENLHQQWSLEGGWKSVLNNVRLLIQPTLMLCLLASWLSVFPNHRLWRGLEQLIGQVNQHQLHYWDG